MTTADQQPTTAAEHSRAARMVLADLTNLTAEPVDPDEVQALIAVAQVHATLAVAAALQATEDRWARWRAEDLERIQAWRAEDLERDVARDVEAFDRQLANSRAANEHAIQLQAEAEQRRQAAWDAEFTKAKAKADDQ